MKKTLFTLGTVALLSTTLFPGTNAFAHTQVIEQTEQQLSDVNRQIERINQAIQDNEKMMNETEQSIQRSQQQLKDLQEETNTIQGRIDVRTSILENRLRALQLEENDVTYLDILLNAKNLGDFIDRVSAVTTIMQADQNLMDEQKKDAEEILKKEQSIKKEIHVLEEKSADLLGMKSQIEEQKAQSMQTKQSLEEQQKEQERLVTQVVVQKAEKQVTAKETRKQTNATAISGATSSTKVASVTNPISKPANGGIQTVISAGNKYIGNSVYVFGGGRTASDIANGRFDCSGFVSWAFKQAGVTVPAYTGGLTGVGSAVSVSDMQPGDLVFFDTYKKDGHVGIYLGNGQFIGSQSSTGVAIANMSSGYWKETFNGRVNRVF